MTCAKQGIHILIEKPLANCYADCQKMIEIAREYGIRATVLQTQRYGSVLQTAKAYISSHSEKLGEWLCVNDQEGCDYCHAGRPAWQ